jgi:hypothetical protein
VPNIYAAGDCTTFVPLASVASMQGRTAIFHALGDTVIPLERRRITANIFTAPEIATVGRQEKDLETGAINGYVYKLPLAANARAKMMGITDGFVKIIAREGGTVIGGVIVAPRASELIYPIAIAVERRLTVDQVSRVFAVFPRSARRSRTRPARCTSSTATTTSSAERALAAARARPLTARLRGPDTFAVRRGCRDGERGEVLHRGGMAMGVRRAPF